MKYLLDTNICINIIRQRPPAILQRFSSYAIGDIAISIITVSELQYGAYKSTYPTQNIQALEQFLTPLIVLDFDYAAATEYGRLRAYLEAQGTPIGSLDTLIAAHALSQRLTVVTNNTREFRRVPNLTVEDWTIP